MRLVWVIPVLAAAIALVAFVTTDDERAPSSRSADLPPSSTAGMAAAWNARLAPLGWEVQRSSLEEQLLDPNRPIPPGHRHLALYLRPTGEPTPQDYIDSLATVTKLFVPALFEAHARLASFDVCLEVAEAVDRSDYPEALTQVVVSRAQAGARSWADLTPADVVAGAERQPNALGLYASDKLQRSPEWTALRSAVTSRGP